jgi:peptide/nickel transport system ATP-binding protein
VNSNTLLAVEDLSVAFDTDEGMVRAVDRVSLEIGASRTLGLVGESGSGKSVTALAIMRLLHHKAAGHTSGKIWFNHPVNGPVDLLRMPERAMQSVRGKHISMVFQEPMTSLNPVRRCGWQVQEGLMWHDGLPPAEARRRVLSLFEEVRLPDPARAYRAWPHELSGGQRQRVMIAMAMACRPSLLIADEPTTALDVTVQKAILELMRGLQADHGMSILFISHDLGVVAGLAPDVSVMRHGQVVESGPAGQVFNNPRHPYTRALVDCRPVPGRRPGRLPVVGDFLEEGSRDTTARPPEQAEERQLRHAALYAARPVLEVRELSTDFITRRSILGKALESFRAVNRVSFSVYPGETLGLVGESGSGKTSLGRSIMQLIRPSGGQVLYRGTDLATLPASALRKLRPRFQIIFQDPYSSLTPGMPVGKAIMEPMRVHGIGRDGKERKSRALELLGRVSLEERHFNRYPHEFSGGQRQRICIARALALEPEFLICDESVSALDVSVQAQVLNLLNELKEDFGLTYIFISHDLSVVSYMSDRILVMKDGEMVELKEADQLLASPSNDYTRQLLAAVPGWPTGRP